MTVELHPGEPKLCEVCWHVALINIYWGSVVAGRRCFDCDPLEEDE